VNDAILVGIAALLPLGALVTVLQRRPAFALLARGMMGGVAVLLYAVLGAPDVALTEALMGTFLVILLYAIAVRATLVVRVATVAEAEGNAPPSCDLAAVPMRRRCHRHHLEVEFLPMEDPAEIARSLASGEVDAAFGEPSVLLPFVGPLCEPPPAGRETILFLGPRLSRTARIFDDPEVGLTVCRATSEEIP
jgi:putative multicomponent Na+:H+ antiporter subunit B